MKAMQTAKWGAFLLLAMFLIWRVISVNIAQHAANQPVENAAIWQVDTPAIQLSDASELMTLDPAKAYQMALRGAWQYPADGRYFVLLAIMLERNQQIEEAKNLIRQLNQLNPRTPNIQLQTGNFWARQGELKLAMTSWGVAIQMQPQLRTAVFPTLLAIAEVPQNYNQVKEVFSRSHDWADEFFMYAVRNAAYIDTLKLLYSARMSVKNGPTSAMRGAYLDRLVRESRWTDAFFVWMNSLSDEQMKSLANVFDGGFEREAPEEGYAWRFAGNDSLRIMAEPTLGATGKRALHVGLLGTQRVPNVLASQRLLLDEGQYRFAGRIKVDNMAAVNGIRWEIVCLGTNARQLLVTEYFVDKMPWRNFGQAFEVPAGCEAQELRLTVHPTDAKRPNLTGSVWFDELLVTFQVGVVR